MEKKYRFTGSTLKLEGIVFHEIQALRNVNHKVLKGTLGGWIEKESDLSHEGNSWVFQDEIVASTPINISTESKEYIAEKNALIEFFTIMCSSAYHQGHLDTISGAYGIVEQHNRLVDAVKNILGEPITTPVSKVLDRFRDWIEKESDLLQSSDISVDATEPIMKALFKTLTLIYAYCYNDGHSYTVNDHYGIIEDHTYFKYSVEYTLGEPINVAVSKILDGLERDEKPFFPFTKNCYIGPTEKHSQQTKDGTMEEVSKEIKLPQVIFFGESSDNMGGRMMLDALGINFEEFEPDEIFASLDEEEREELFDDLEIVPDEPGLILYLEERPSDDEIRAMIESREFTVTDC